MGRERRRWWQSRRTSVVLVTGGAGFLGRHVGRHAGGPWQVVAPPHSMLDVRRADAVADAVKEWRPKAVLHLAYQRDDPRSIVDASHNVARAAHASGVRLVHLSTDLVFRGRSRPYTEADTTDAVADYGRWKAEAEARVAETCPGAVMVRTSLLYGTDDPGPQLDLVRQAARTGRPTFFTDEFRCPTHAGDLARILLRLASMPEVTGPLHVASGEPMSRADFARALARWAGIDDTALPTTTLAESEMAGGTGGARPGRVVLDVSRATDLGFTCRPVGEVLRRR